MNFRLFAVRFLYAVDYTPPGMEEFCAGETFQPRCPGGKQDVIIVLAARYGRMKTGRCVKDEPGLGTLIENPMFLGCHADVKHILDNHCSGRSECDVRVLDQNFVGIEPCLTYLKLYLEASYMCVKGNLTEPHNVIICQCSDFYRSTLHDSSLYIHRDVY